jgi:hypothetical protein
VILVGVDGPVSEHHIRPLALKDFQVLVIARVVHFDFAVHLPCEDWARLENLACLLSFRGSDQARLVVSLTLNAALAARQVEDHDLMPRVRKPSDGAAAAGFRVVRVCPCNHHPHGVWRNTGSPCRGRAHGKCSGRARGLPQ